MFCQQCGQALENDARFCPVCGRAVTISPPPAAPPAPEPYTQAANTYTPPTPAPYTQSAKPYTPPVQSAAPAAHSYQAKSSAPAAANKPTIKKGAWITVIILSAIAMISFLICITESFITNLNEHDPVFYAYQLFCSIEDFFILIGTFVFFFILCILLKKIPPFITGFPSFAFALILLSEIFFSVTNIKIFGVTYELEPLTIVVFLTFIAGSALYTVTLALNSKPLAMKIITTVLFSVYAAFLIYWGVDAVTRAVSEVAPYMDTLSVIWICIKWNLPRIAYLCLTAAMIIILFSSKRKAAAPPPSLS